MIRVIPHQCREVECGGKPGLTLGEQIPEPLVPGRKFATPADAVKAFNAARDKTIAYVKSTQDDLRTHVGPGPAGPMDSYQFLLLLTAHSARHAAQIREVEANPSYPKA